MESVMLKIVAKLDNLEPNKCWLWTGPRVGRRDCLYGHARFRFPGDASASRFYVHRAAYMVEHDLLELPDTITGVQMSHLCHSTLCCNPAHLSLEPQHVNNSRNNCKQEGSCKHHPGFHDCLLHQ